MDDMEQPAELLDSDAAVAAAEDHDQQAANHDAQADAASQEQAEEDEEIEIGGKKVAMPKSIAAEIKAGTMRNADYTQKTQALSADRKAFEAEREQSRQQAQQHIKEVAKVHALDDQLEQYKQIDWNRLSDEDPIHAQKLHFQYQALQQQRQQAAEAVTQKQNEHALATQQETAKQIQDAEAYVRREIPSWSPERTAQINAFAEAQGVKMDPETARFLLKNPAMFKVLHNAELFDQLSKKQAAKPATPAAPPAPVTRVGASRATAAKDPSKMSTSEWMEQRNKQLRSKR